MKAFRVAALVMLAALCAAPGVSAQQQPAPQQPNLVPQPMREKEFPIGVPFIAVSLNGRAFPGEPPAMLLDTTFRLRGFSGCNNYSATAYPQPEQGIAVGPFAMTRRSCERALMDAERAFLTALRAAQKWDTDGAMLTIRGPGGELRLQRSL